MVKRLVLAGAALALGVGMTVGAMASDRAARKAGHHVGRFHAGKTHHVARGPENQAPGNGNLPSYGGFISLGPLGMTAACGSYPRGHGYCGPTNGAPIDAWSY